MRTYQKNQSIGNPRAICVTYSNAYRLLREQASYEQRSYQPQWYQSLLTRCKNVLKHISKQGG